MDISQISNRHIAKCLDNVEALCPNINPLAKVAIKREMYFLAKDIQQVITSHSKENDYDREINHNR